MSNEPKSIGDILDRLEETAGGAEKVSFGQIVESLGHRSQGPFLIVPALLEITPIGSIPGVLIGAVLLGIAEALTVTLASSALQELAGMGLFLLVLFVMPNGLFGAARRRG